MQNIVRLQVIIFTLFSPFLKPAESFCNTTAEPARMLVHTISYIGNDYGNAVSGGKVINEDEYNEMLEFIESAQKYLNELSHSWNAADSGKAAILMKQLQLAVQTKDEPIKVDKLASVLKQTVITITNLKTYPSQHPDIENGKKLYTANCVQCHGTKGFGDGPAAAALVPKPLSFHNADRMSATSAAHTFNTIRLGMAGTAMVPFPDLKDDEVWDLAFYVLSLRYEGVAASTATPPAISLEEIATLNDKELVEKYNLSDEQIAALRLKKLVLTSDVFLQKADKYLLEVLEYYRSSDNSKAGKYATLAYLEGIEPVEASLKATDPALGGRIEQQFFTIRKLIARRVPETELADSVEAARASLREAQNLLQNKEYSFWLALAMSLSVLLREGLEAFLIILIILSVLRAANLNGAIKWVHIGWLSATATGVCLWFASSAFIAKNIAGVELFEGVISLIAVAMLIYIGFWLHGKSSIAKWKEYVNSHIQTATNGGSVLGLVSLSYFVVFREVFESVLFLSAIHIESQGKQGYAILTGVLLAFVILLVFAVAVLRFSSKLPIPTLFRVSSAVMGLLAFVLAGKGIHSFQEVNWVPVHGIPFIRVELLGIYPTIETTAAQAIVAGFVILLLKKK
ncbi:MAG: FTR1 family protein [Chitinophagales bacterium]|nr:FTR1 family protein [Chitinophagales bacterium]